MNIKLKITFYMHFNISVGFNDATLNLLESKNIKIFNSLEIPQERYGFSNLLNEQKNKIDQIDSEIWKKIRWYINDYDFLVKDPIINRAFYKYWEIIFEFEIFENIKQEDIIFHCAEAPGGFIQGTNIFLQLDNYVIPTIQKVSTDEDGFTIVKKKKIEKKYKIYTISLNKDLPKYKNYNLPSYNKNIINKRIYVSYGKDNTGDINNLENIHYIASKVGSFNSFYLITADGGFDEGNEFNNKEQLHYFLILNEIYTSISLQKLGGSFILKVFDIFTETSINLLYLLNTLYKDVFIYKPKTSRPTNSEKYIICKNFNPSTTYLNKVKSLILFLSNSLKSKGSVKYANFNIFKTIPESFVKKIYDCNVYLLEKQCKFLNEAIILCENKEFISNYDKELSNSIEKRKTVFKEWEKFYNLDSYVPS
jgi:23S rRNA U2552 (ribose-2'-O)-methylase RlmE/FtsJ